jgi:integrase/recombinase XerD
MGRRCRVEVSEPLRLYADGFRAELAKQGYKPLSADQQLRLMAHLGRWLTDEDLELEQLTDRVVARFLRARRADGYVTFVSVGSLRVVLGYLRDRGVLPVPASGATDTAVEASLVDYGDYLAVERGLAAGTVSYYLPLARLFLREHSGGELSVVLADIDAAQVTSFVLAQCAQRSAESAKTLVCGLRSLMRFLFVKGFVSRPLADVVPTVARRPRRLPRGLDRATVQRLLRSCDQHSTTGRRDYAILLLLVRLGLRSCEVAALTLDDIDWRAGELLIRVGKSRRRDRLPLPDDVGKALAGYLRRGRPRSADRALFVRVYAPRAGLSANGVKQAVRHACGRAGVPECGAHRLRHTAATDLLQAGAPLAEIAQLLRHRSVSTTAIYATVDRAALFALARPWPGGAA